MRASQAMDGAGSSAVEDVYMHEALESPLVKVRDTKPAQCVRVQRFECPPELHSCLHARTRIPALVIPSVNDCLPTLLPDKCLLTAHRSRLLPTTG